MQSISESMASSLQINEKDFIGMLVEYVKRDIPQAVTGLAFSDIQKMVFYAIKKAKSYGFNYDVDIAAFVTVMFEVAPNFDEHPVVQQLLIDEFNTQGERFDHIVEKIPQYVWKEAESLYDTDAWIPQLKARRNTRLRRYTQVNRS